MDPFSLTVGIIALLDFTKEVVDYYKTVSGSTKDGRRLDRELKSVQNSLEALDEEIKSDGGGEEWAKTMKNLEAPDGPVTIMREVLELAIPKTKNLKGLKALRWPFNKPDVVEMLDIIGRQRGLIVLALDNNNRSVYEKISAAN